MGMSQEVFGRRSTGEGSTYRERLMRCVKYPECRVDMADGYLTSHRQRLHGTKTAINWDRLRVSQNEHPSQVYRVRTPRDISKYQCPFPGFP